MANLQVKDGAAATKYLKSSGAGTDLDPHIPQHLETNSAALLAAVDGVEANQATEIAALATLAGHVDGLETAVAATNTKLDTVNTNLTTIDGRVDGLEAKLDSIITNTAAATPAGNNNIGDVDIASIAAGDNNIGNVDVVSLPALPAGTNTIGNVGIAEKTLLFATGTAASSGDNTIIAAPGSNVQIKIVALQIQNESSTATTMILKFGSTAKWRCLGQSQGDGVALPIPAGRAWPVGNNAALVLNLSGANSCGYSVCYYTEAV